MDRAALLEMFRTKAAEVAEKDFPKLDDASVIASLGVDSLAMLEVVGEMERSLSVTVPDDLLVGIQTVGQLLDVFQKRMKS